LIQLLIYLKATGLKRGFLLYVNKNDQTFLVIPVELDETNDKIIEDVFEWLRTVRKAFDEGQLAEIPFTRARNAGEPSNKICRGCPVNQTCFNEQPKGDVFIPLMEVPKI
jgi:CRISPR/Cas system-associated exonuclease Cas4 (RecB family)